MSIMQFTRLISVSITDPLVHARNKGPRVNRSLFHGTDYVLFHLFPFAKIRKLEVQLLNLLLEFIVTVYIFFICFMLQSVR